MSDALTLQDTKYGLADATVLSEPWLSPATLPDALAQSAIAATREEPGRSVLQKIVIRKRGLELFVEIHATAPMPSSFVKGLERVLDLLTLPPGWNSYSAKPIAPQIAIIAIRLLAEVVGFDTPVPAVVPTVRGGIQLEWHCRGTDIEVYIESPNEVSFFAEQIGSGESFEGPLSGGGLGPGLQAWLQRVSGK